MKFDDLKLTTELKFNRFLDEKIHRLLPQIIWEVEVHSENLNELHAEFERTDIWKDSGMGNGLREQYIDDTNPLIDSFINSFARKTRNQIMTMMFDEHPHITKQMWFMPKEHYAKHCHTHPIIFRDLPGFKTTVHKDNSHNMFQIVLNLSDNEPMGTEFFTFDSLEPFYKGTGEIYKGAAFINTTASPHIIRDVTRPRYNLNLAVYAPTWAKEWNDYGIDAE